MSTYRGKSYTYAPVCVFCGEPTNEKLDLITVSSRYGSRETVEAPGHRNCLTRRGLIMIGLVLVSLAAGLLVIPLILAWVLPGTISALGQLASILVVPPVGVWFSYAWFNAPRNRFLREHELAGLPRQRSWN